MYNNTTDTMKQIRRQSRETITLKLTVQVTQSNSRSHFILHLQHREGITKSRRRNEFAIN